jgi:hypothetical protein
MPERLGSALAASANCLGVGGQRGGAIDSSRRTSKDAQSGTLEHGAKLAQPSNRDQCFARSTRSTAGIPNLKGRGSPDERREP